MKRILLAGLLALPVLLVSTSSASAQGCASGNCGAGGFGGVGGCGLGFGAFARSYQGGTQHLGCGACFGFFQKIHFHGPLYNYGPYAGYYPFAPYGPWNAQLQYTGPRPDSLSSGWIGHGCRHCGGRHGLGESCGGHGHGRGRGAGCDTCGGWKDYSVKTFHNVFKRVGCHKKGGCEDGSCGVAAAPAEPAPVLEPNPIQTTGFPRTER